MAGGGGTFSRDRTPQKIQEQVRRAEERAISAEFDGKVNEHLGDLLSKYNSRDVEAIQARLSDLRRAVGQTVEGTIDTVFGGSVAKHTYVDGLSDVDSLAIFGQNDMAGAPPSVALKRLRSAIDLVVSKGIRVDAGSMAVTVEYPDGMTIQILPAVRAGNRLKVPSWGIDAWSSIDPDGFRVALTKRNDECGKKLVPTIKLAKAINAALPKSVQLSGYHLESLAIDAFRDYKGPCTFTSMLQHLFEHAPARVLQPLADKTGQSIHVDEYLGPAESEVRLRVSNVLNRVGRRMKNAQAAGSLDQWRELFEF